MYSLVFIQVRGVMMADVIKQLLEISYISITHISTIKIVYLLCQHHVAYNHINRNSFFSSIRNSLPVSNSTKCLHLREEWYHSTKSYILQRIPILNHCIPHEKYNKDEMRALVYLSCSKLCLAHIQVQMWKERHWSFRHTIPYSKQIYW